MNSLEVTVISTEKLLFEGRANQVVVPGEQGVFQIYPFHKSIVSRLLPGVIYVDGETFDISHGVVKVDQNVITVLIQPAVVNSGQ